MPRPPTPPKPLPAAGLATHGATPEPVVVPLEPAPLVTAGAVVATGVEVDTPPELPRPPMTPAPPMPGRPVPLPGIGAPSAPPVLPVLPEPIVLPLSPTLPPLLVNGAFPVPPRLGPPLFGTLPLSPGRGVTAPGVLVLGVHALPGVHGVLPPVPPASPPGRLPPGLPVSPPGRPVPPAVPGRTVLPP